MSTPTFIVPVDAGFAIGKDNLPLSTNKISIGWLAEHNNVSICGRVDQEGFLLHPDTFTDKSMVLACSPTTAWVFSGLRVNDSSNMYMVSADNAATNHMAIWKISAGTSTSLATNVASIYSGILVGSASGSTIKELFYNISTPINPLDTSAYPSTAAGSLSATDTTFASGKYGVGTILRLSSIGASWVMDPFTRLPPVQVIIEVPITESEDGKIVPNLPHKYVEVKDLTPEQKKLLTPEQLKEAKRYYTLKAKGYTDDEIEALVGKPLFHQVDMLSVNWGAFDHKGENTMVVMVREGNQFNPNAISDLVSTAKQKGWEIHKIPQNPSLEDIANLHKAIKQSHPDIIAGKHDLAYQVLGHEDLEPLAVADYYNGFVEGTYDFKNVETVPDPEMKHIIHDVWKPRLRKAKVPAMLKEEHMNRLIRFAKERGV